MADISIYEPSLLVFVDKTGCDCRNTTCKYGYSFKGMPVHDKYLLVRGIWYSAIPVLSVNGIHDIYLVEGRDIFYRCNIYIITVTWALVICLKCMPSVLGLHPWTLGISCLTLPKANANTSMTTGFFIYACLKGSIMVMQQVTL